MTAARLPVAALALLALALAASAQTEVEPFGPQGFTNPFLQHDFEFGGQPLWDIENVGGGNWALHLQPNTDWITWDLPPGQLVHSVSAIMVDYETEPFGPGGTSSFIARSSSGDFARFNTVNIGVPELALIDVNAPGQLTGFALGDIVQIQLQASNTGGPGGIGCYWDDITITLVDSAFVDLGQALAGTNGAPGLLGESTLLPGSLLKLTVSGALPGATSTLVAGLSALQAPFKGGVLVPQPDLLLFGLPIGGDGSSTLSATWPEGIPPGVTLFLQQWIADPGGPAGFAATNAIAGTTP
jgi:hypothetical protein